MVTVNLALEKKLKKNSLIKRLQMRMKYYFFKKYSYEVHFLNEKFQFCIENFEGEICWGKNMLDRKGLTPELAWMKEYLIKPGDIIADVGAHQGFYALLFSTWVSQKGEVHSFECAKSIYEILKKNLAINNVTNVYPNYCAVGGEQGEILAPEYLSTGILLTHNSQKMTKIPLIKLDDFFKNKKLPSVLKIDVEGYEWEVLTGSENILKNKPKINLELHNFAHKDPKPRLEKIFDMVSHYNEIYFQPDREKNIQRTSFSTLSLNEVLEYPNPHIYLLR